MCIRDRAKELMKDKQSMQARAESGENRVKDVLGMRDAVVEERSRALESLAAAQAENMAVDDAPAADAMET